MSIEIRRKNIAQQEMQFILLRFVVSQIRFKLLFMIVDLFSLFMFLRITGFTKYFFPSGYYLGPSDLSGFRPFIILLYYSVLVSLEV